MTEIDEAALVCRGREGDPAATESLIRRYRPIVFRYCLAKLGDRFAADDVTQETCMAIVQALPRYRDQGTPFGAYVIGIAANKIRMARRTAANRHDIPTDIVKETTSAAAGPEQLAVDADALAGLRRLLAELPSVQAEIVILRAVTGLSADETGAVVGMSAGAVRVAQHRALARLRELHLEGRHER